MIIPTRGNTADHHPNRKFISDWMPNLLLMGYLRLNRFFRGYGTEFEPIRPPCGSDLLICVRAGVKSV